MSRRNLEGVTPARVMLAWSQHQPCLEEGSRGSSEPTIHPAACKSLRAPKLPGTHTQRGPRCVHSPEASFPPASQGAKAKL